MPHEFFSTMHRDLSEAQQELQLVVGYVFEFAFVFVVVGIVFVCAFVFVAACLLPYVLFAACPCVLFSCLIHI